MLPPSIFALTVTLKDARTAYGVQFPDQSIYVHEPLVDTWGNEADLLRDERISHYQVIGQLLSLPDMKAQLDKDYVRVLSDLDEQKALIKRQYKRHEEALDELATIQHKEVA